MSDGVTVLQVRVGRRSEGAVLVRSGVGEGGSRGRRSRVVVRGRSGEAVGSESERSRDVRRRVGIRLRTTTTGLLRRRDVGELRSGCHRLAHHLASPALNPSLPISVRALPPRATDSSLRLDDERGFDWSGVMREGVLGVGGGGEGGGGEGSSVPFRTFASDARRASDVDTLDSSVLASNARGFAVALSGRRRKKKRARQCGFDHVSISSSTRRNSNLLRPNLPKSRSTPHELLTFDFLLRQA